MMAVPPGALWVSSDVSRSSPKGYTERDLAEIAATVPFIYEAMDAGCSGDEMLMKRFSASPADRNLGETYYRIFRDGNGDGFKASFEGGRLEVDAGNHRIRAAQEIGIPAVPVTVFARSEAELDALDSAFRQEMRAIGAEQVIRVHEAERTELAYRERDAMRERARSETLMRDYGPELNR